MDEKQLEKLMDKIVTNVTKMYMPGSRKQVEEALKAIAYDINQYAYEYAERVIGKSELEFHDPDCYQYQGFEYCHCIAKPDMARNQLRESQRKRNTELSSHGEEAK